MRNTESTETSELVLGWKVSDTGEPEYWLDPNAKLGATEQEKYLVKVPAGAMGTHTIIIAQSGSGKSFFLGRIIEELMIRTQCNCIILDPNADFRPIHNIESEYLWSKAHYIPGSYKGKLPHESCRSEFEEQWKNVSIEVMGRGYGLPGEPFKQLKLRLPELSVEFLGGDLEPLLRSDLDHYHALVQSFDTLLRYTGKRWRNVGKPIDLLTKAQDWLAEKLSKDDLRERLTEEFLEETNDADDFVEKFARSKKEEAIERIVAATDFRSEPAERFYFGKARVYEALGILDTTLKPGSPVAVDKKRLKVVDLPTLPDKSTRLLVINALLTKIWDEARSAWKEALKELRKTTRACRPS